MWPTLHLRDVLSSILCHVEPQLEMVKLSDCPEAQGDCYFDQRTCLMSVCKEWRLCINKIPFSLTKSTGVGSLDKYDYFKVAKFCGDSSSVLEELVVKTFCTDSSVHFMAAVAKCQKAKRISIKCFNVGRRPHHTSYKSIKHGIRLSALETIQCPLQLLMRMELQKPCDVTIHAMWSGGLMCNIHQFMNWLLQQKCRIRKFAMMHSNNTIDQHIDDSRSYVVLSSVEDFLWPWIKNLQGITHLDLDILLDIASPVDVNTDDGPFCLQPLTMASLRFIQTLLPTLQSLTVSSRQFNPTSIVELARKVSNLPESAHKSWCSTFLLNLCYFRKKKATPFFDLQWKDAAKIMPTNSGAYPFEPTTMFKWVISTIARNPLACPKGIISQGMEQPNKEVISETIKLLALSPTPLSQEAWAHLWNLPSRPHYDMWLLSCEARHLLMDKATSLCETFPAYPAMLSRRWGKTATWAYYLQHPNIPLPNHIWRNDIAWLIIALEEKVTLHQNQAAIRQLESLVKLAWERHALWQVLLCDRTHNNNNIKHFNAYQPKAFHNAIKQNPQINNTWLAGAPPTVLFAGIIHSIQQRKLPNFELKFVNSDEEESESTFAASYFAQNPAALDTEIYLFKPAFEEEKSVDKRKAVLIYMQQTIFATNKPPSPIQRAFLGGWFELLMRGLTDEVSNDFLKHCQCWFSYWSYPPNT